jgi:hypothetical protein
MSAISQALLYRPMNDYNFRHGCSSGDVVTNVDNTNMHSVLSEISQCVPSL